MKNQLSGIFSQFVKDKVITGVGVIGSGHINDTYLIKTDDVFHPGYIIQRINSYIFKNVENLMNNIRIVTEHIASVYKSSAGQDAHKKVLSFYPVENGKYYYLDSEGNYWRCCDYISDTVSYNLVTDPSVAYKGGELFGKFQKQLSTLNPMLLADTIPKFHDMEWRWANFQDAVERDPVNRLVYVKKEIEFAYKRYTELVVLTKDVRSGKLPMRITHNDTKFNNILFSANGEALCVIDLDTVMPGTVLHDFGDAIRSACNTASEDEADISKIGFNMQIFEAYTRGYLSEASYFLTKYEIDNLVLSCRFMTFIMGLRFLTDYLDGDIYYKIHHPQHNVRRCRAQFRLIECMEDVNAYMVRIVAESYKLLK